MSTIRQRVCFLTIAVGLGILASGVIFLEDAALHRLYTEPLLVVAVLVTALLLNLLISAKRKLERAKLIIENKIFYVKTAKLDAGKHCESNHTLHPGIEIFISCFGILLNSQVINFDFDGIQLKTVEIGREFICLIYGTDVQNHKIRIHYAAIGKEELQSIVERFRYETGVIPVIIESPHLWH